MQQVLLKGRGLMTRYGIKSMKKILSFLLVITAFLFVGGHFVDIDAFSGNKTVTITGIFDPAATGVTFSDSVVYPYGSKVSMDLSGTPAGQTFAFWVVNGVVEPDLAINNQFTITNDMNLQVVFTPADKVVAVFIDVNGELLGYRYATSGSEVDITGIPVPSRPGYIANTSSDHRFENILNGSTIFDLVENSVFVQRYIRDSYDDYEITVTNGSGTDFYLFNSIATVVANAAPEGQKFSHWEENGIKVSAHESYVFSVLYDRNLTAVFVPTATVLEDEVIVTISNDLELRPGYHSYIGQIEIPAGYSVIEYGFFMGNEAIILDQTHNSNVVQATNIHPITKEFVSSMSIGSHMSVRAYVVVSDGITQTIVTSDRNHRYLKDNVRIVDFEHTDYPAGTDYQKNPTIGPAGEQWEFYYGTTSTTGAINGSKSAQMRFYTATPNNLGYMESLFAVGDVDFIRFNALAYANITLTVSYSTDGIDWVSPKTFYPSTSVKSYSYGIDTNDPVFLLFQLGTVQGSTPANAARLIIDNIEFLSFYDGTIRNVDFVESETKVLSYAVKDGGTISSYTPTRTGYTFNGWFDNDLYSGDAYNFATAISSDLSLYAKWTINQYTVTFNTNGGTAVPDLTEDYNAEILAPVEPTKEGYTFDGWYSDAGLLTPYTFTTMPAQNITLYAKWNINQYTITFESNGGSSVTAITQDFNTAVTEPTDPTKTDYTFSGWFTDDITFENEYTFSTMPAQNITLYAKWISAASSVTVTFDSDGGSEVSQQILESGSLITEPSDPTKTGYTFVKWEDSFGVEWNFAVNTVTENITLTAVWTINQYTISFNVDGGSSVSPITQDYDTAVVAPADPTKTDYTFGGWYSDAGLTSAYTFSTMPAQNIMVYAKWVSLEPTPFAVYTFDHITSSSTTSYTDSTLKSSLDSGLSGTNKLSSVTNTARVYPGNSSSGTYQLNNLLKLGTSSAGASFTMNMTDANVTKVIIYIEPWTTSTNVSLTINGIAKVIQSAAGSYLVYEFESASNVIAFSTNARAFIFKIELYSE